MSSGLRAPFPYFGGKGRLAPEIWKRLGNPTVYAEPFAGSVACLLARPDGAEPREVVCDLDGGLCNVWRALIADPDQVAYWADYPTIHQDLTARHAWLRDWVAENRDRLSADPDYCDPKAAGWWLWGISLWIGGGWCHVDSDRRPHIDGKGGGQGVAAQRATFDQIPKMGRAPGGTGVAAQRVSYDRRPHMHDRAGGRGVSAQRRARPELLAWFAALQERLHGVIVLNRDWTSALTPTVLMQTASAAKPPVGVLLDPPYRTSDRSDTIYGSDFAGVSDDAAEASYLWAVENGDKYRVAYCAHEGDFVVPDDWTTISNSFGAIQKAERRDRRDLVMFSPACLSSDETLF